VLHRRFVLQAGHSRRETEVEGQEPPASPHCVPTLLRERFLQIRQVTTLVVLSYIVLPVFAVIAVAPYAYSSLSESPGSCAILKVETLRLLGDNILPASNSSMRYGPSSPADSSHYLAHSEPSPCTGNSISSTENCVSVTTTIEKRGNQPTPASRALLPTIAGLSKEAQREVIIASIECYYTRRSTYTARHKRSRPFLSS
jgi:hypothetical protein